MSEFGASQRQVINDTNAGKVKPLPKATTRSLNSGGRNVTQVGGGSNPDVLTNTLVNIGKQIIPGMIDRANQADYAEGFDRGLEDGFEKNARSPLRDMLFGKNATLRGAQDRIVANDGRDWQNQEMANIKDNVSSMDEDEYKEYLVKSQEEHIGKYDDPDMRMKLGKMATKSMESLARNHAQQRQAWVDLTNRESVKNTVLSATDRMRNAQQYGDEEDQRQAQTDADEMFDQPLDMDPARWLETVNQAIVASLGKGDDLAYRMAEKQGIIAMMTPGEKQKLGTAKGIHDRDNSRKFHDDTSTLTASMKKGSVTDAQLVSYANKYKGSGANLNKLRSANDEYASKLAEIAREKASHVDMYNSGDAAFADLSSTEQQSAVSTRFDELAATGLQIKREAASKTGEYTGDMSAPFAAAEKSEYLLDNPMQFAHAWAKHPDIKTPMVQNLITNSLSVLRSDTITEEQSDQLTKQMQALNVFKELDGQGFNNQFRSNYDASQFAAFDFLVNKAGQHPTNAYRELRSLKDTPDFEPGLDQNKSRLADVSDDVADEFLDSNEESQGILGLYNVTPDNEAVFNSTVKSYVEEAMVAFKGREDLAVPAAIVAMRRNSIVSNGQFIPNGKKLDIKGGSVEDFIRGVDSNPDMRAAIANSGNGFAIDADYSNMEISLNPWDEKTVILHDVHAATGAPISIKLNLPQKGSDFSPYGVANFFGIHDKLERSDRIKYFTSNNPFVRGHANVGRIVDKPVDVLQGVSDANQAFGTHVLNANERAGQAILDSIKSIGTGFLSEVATSTDTEAAQPVNYSPTVQSILKSEGGYQNQTTDRGNKNSKGEFVGTNFGISAPFLEKKLGRVPTVQDVKSITEAQAAQWHQENVDKEAAALTKATGKTVAPESELLLAHATTLTGRRGMIKVFKKLPDNATPKQFAKAYLDYLKTLSSWKKYGKGWTNRVNEKLAQSK